MNLRHYLLTLLALHISLTASADVPEGNITFADPVVKAICVAHWDTNSDGELSYAEAAAVNSLSSAFSDGGGGSSNTRLIKSFDELQYFTGLNSIGDLVFFYCEQLTSVILPPNITSIGGGAFQCCSSLTSINIPESVTSIGSYTFMGAKSLTSVTIPENVTSIGEGAFSSCSSLTSVNIPEGVTSIGYSAFNNCSSLTSLTIPEGVTTIGGSAFSGCSSLTSITIPENVTSIGEEAFNGIPEVNLTSTTPPQITSRIGSDCTVFIVPEGSISSYRNADVWSEFNTWIVRDTKCNKEIDVSDVVVLDNQSKIETTIGQDNLLDIVSLKVSGHIDSRDFMILRAKMPNLRFLDLTDTSIDANEYEYYSGCHSETNVLGPNVFRDTKLYSVKVPSTITVLGEGAFAYCGNLKQVTLNEGLISIGDWAFCESGVTDINFPESLESVGWVAFHRAPLKDVVLNNRLRYIGPSCFSWNEKLTTLVLSESLETIDIDAFSNDVNLKTVIVKNPLPIAITDNIFANSNVANATLYVPELESVKEKYYWANGWSGFLKREEYHPEYEVILLQDPEDLAAGDGKDQFSGVNDQAPDADLRPGSGFIKEGEEDVQQLDDVDQCISEDGTSASIIAKDDGEDVGNLDIDNLSVKIRVQANTWYFFCFPYDVKISECTYPGDYVWKGYQGALRASNGKGWKNVTGEKLHASSGYAFLTTTEGTLIINFKNPKFGGDRTKELEESLAENPQDANWNFVGNPYSCYYDFEEDDYSAPITVWDGTSYVAYRPGDDDIHLRPYEAFFVQKIGDEIDFSQDRRETYKQSKNNKANQVRARRVRGLNPDRLMLNLYVTNTDASIVDRTRVVLNEQSSRAYELQCDAAKFLSSSAVPQIYSLEGSTQYAINERPSNGDIRLGYIAPKAGRLSIGAERMDQPMMLVDTDLNTTFDLSLGTYDFDTKAGSFNSRFLLRAAGDQTGLITLRQQTGIIVGTQPGGIAIGGAEDKTVNVYTTGGALAAQLNGNGFIALKGGLYIVLVDGVSAKVNVK